MQIINYSYELSDEFKPSEYFHKYYPDSKLLFFDIETTGLSAKNSTLYLIGALWYDNNKINLRQWFNDDGYDEKEILSSFNCFCKEYTHLVHFNGITFDIPYIKEKSKKYSVSIEYIDKLKQIDIYKEIRSYKNILGLENVKQITIEQYLGVKREDIYSGGELINIYQRYVARPDEEKKNLLLLHNHDDLLGMPAISKILQYKAFFEDPEIIINSFTFDKDNMKITLEISLPKNYCRIPKRLIHSDRSGIYINAIDDYAIIIIPVMHDNLKHYFEDYKNYYYLPKEDQAIHKSVASYVEPENREKCTKSNCYIIKRDFYIPCPDHAYPEVFKKDIKEKAAYRSYNSLINGEKKHQVDYVRALIKSVL